PYTMYGKKEIADSTPTFTGRLRSGGPKKIFMWGQKGSTVGSATAPQAIVKDIHLQLRAKLIGLDRDGKVSSPTRVRRQKKTYLSIWFGKVQG
ncbi:hypothetical protein HID58_043292, partial [Brassica napus]